MNVANKQIIRKLTMRFLNAARTRNVIAIIAVALTSVMFTSVFTLGGSIIAAVQDETMRQIGTSAHGGLKYLSTEQYEHFAKSPLLKDISYNRLISFAENEELKKEQCEIRYSEDKAARWWFSYPTVGEMPQGEKEIACNTIVLNALGIPHEIGAEIPLEFTVGGRKYSETFTLSGFWEGDRAMMAQQIWLSQTYVDALISENTIAEGDYAGLISADVWFSNSFDIDGKMRKLISERGYSEGEIAYGASWAYMGNVIEIAPVIIIAGIFALGLILLSGYLIIYSVFIITVNTDIHFYGLLKTIGTTGKQIRNIIRAQAVILSAAGIPFGLLIGYFAGVELSPLLTNIFSEGFHIKATANPLIFIFAAAFSLLTILSGCRKPERIAAAVSPVEAVKYSGVSTDSKRKIKKTRKVTPLSMAWAGVTREKRKFCMIILSLSLSMILLNGAFSATKSFDLDSYLSGSLISDFAVADYSVFSALAPHKNTEGVTEEFLNEAKSLGADISCIYYHSNNANNPDINGGTTISQIYGAGEKELASFSDIDYEKLRSGNYIIVSKMVITHMEAGLDIPEIGDTVTLTDKNGNMRIFEVIGQIDSYPHHLSARFYIGSSLTFVVADEVFLDFLGETQPMQANMNLPDENIAEFQAWLESYISNQNPDLEFISRESLKAEFDGLRTTFIALGGAMSFILALIGILNFINAVATSVIARRREFAMLQSVGMTGKQLRSTLFFEGGCHAVFAIFLTLTAGVGLGLMIVQVIAGQAWFFKPNYTVMPSLYCAIPLLLICAVAPLVCCKRLARESLVERLRTE